MCSDLAPNYFPPKVCPDMFQDSSIRQLLCLDNMGPTVVPDLSLLQVTPGEGDGVSALQSELVLDPHKEDPCHWTTA